MPKKLLLIHPQNKMRIGMPSERSTCYMPMSLGIVANLTPRDWDVELLDESFEDFTFKPADLVALTSFTSNCYRAYEIAAVYREKGIHTVMGGVHVTMCPEEALKYVDTVVTGEAEGAWPVVIADFEAGTIKNLYDGGNVDPSRISPLRREIYKYPYNLDLIQTSRGCPWGCDFCSVTHMCGKTYRERDVDDVLDELEETTRTTIFFVDDNLVNNRKGAEERAIRLFKGMVERGMKKSWFSQAALNFADNEEVLYWARKCGCSMIFMGIEAEDPDALKDIGKKLNLRRGINSYEKIFKKIHKHGISVLGAMIFGMDSDTKEDFLKRAEFLRKSSVDAYQCSVLTPLPGTTLFERVNKEGRIALNNYPYDWQHYHFMSATINTPGLTTTEIDAIMEPIVQKLYSKKSMRKKMFRTLWNTRSFLTSYWAYYSNHNYARICLEKCGDLPPNFSEKIYVKITDKIFWLIYQFFWNKRLRFLSGRTSEGDQS